MNTFRMSVSIFLVVGLLAGTALALNMETVPVGDAGNAADTRYVTPGFGAVAYAYNIGKYEVTAGQYTEFLNAVAKTDTYGLYNTKMADTSTQYVWGCNIQRTGSSGSYSYSVAADWANRPVNYVSWADAARFANWMNNGQPTGVQDLSTTEDGSYYLNGAVGGSALWAVTRKAGARYVTPTEDEWYKAAYYDPNKPGGAGYWDYPTRSDAKPSNVLSSTESNNANYYDADGAGTVTIGAPYWRTQVGAFASSPGPYGTFDQGGNVWEMNETVIDVGYRGERGGSFFLSDTSLKAAARHMLSMGVEGFSTGFRVSEVPEPASLVLLALGGMAVMRCPARRRRFFV